MIKLERIVPGSRLTGVIGDETVEILSTRACGPDAVEVTWRGPEGLGDRILFRDDEPGLREVAPARRFAFDGKDRKNKASIAMVAGVSARSLWGSKSVREPTNRGRDGAISRRQTGRHVGKALESEGHGRRGAAGLGCTRGRSQDRAGEGQAGGWVRCGWSGGARGRSMPSVLRVARWVRIFSMSERARVASGTSGGLDARDDAQRAATHATVFDVDVEDALEPLHPAYGRATRRGRPTRAD